MSETSQASRTEETREDEAVSSLDSVCPVCGERVIQEKCKVLCRSKRCTYRIIYTCAEF